MSVESVLAALLRDVPGCRFSGLLDLDIGLIGSVSPEDHYSDAELDELASLAVAAFEGDEVAAIGAALAGEAGRGIDDDSYVDHVVEELLIVSAGLLYAFLRLIDSPGRVICLVSTRLDAADDVVSEARRVLSEVTF